MVCILTLFDTSYIIVRSENGIVSSASYLGIFALCYQTELNIKLEKHISTLNSSVKSKSLETL